LHIPACGENCLLSVSQLRRLGIFVEFPPSGAATMRYSNGSWVEVMDANGLYGLRPIRGEVLGLLEVNKGFAIDTGEGAVKEAALWPFKLVHLRGEAVLRLSLEDNNIPSLLKVPRCVCTGCVYEKITRRPFPSILPSSRVTQPLEIIHRDLAGPINPESLGGALYLLMFTDDYTRYKVGYLLKHKSETFARFKEYKALGKKQQGKIIRMLRLDEGGEYICQTSSVISYNRKE